MNKHLRQLRRTLLSMGESDFVPGNRVTLLHNGEAYFPAIETAFDQARHEIHLAAYIYADDATGRRISDALIRAAARGVSVYVLIDGYGSKALSRSLQDRLRAGGVKTLIFRPRISPWTFRRKRLRRMHRKIVVVDRKIAFVGGINIVSDKGTAADASPRYDYTVAVEGPLVDVIRLSAQRLWSTVAWSRFRKGTVRRALPASTFTGGSMKAVFLTRDNVHHRRDIEEAYLRAINQAESEIILAHAYFLPGLEFRHALIEAVGRGVRVVLLLQGRVEYLLEHYASRALCGSLLDAGVEIHEYGAGYLHAKVAVIDGHWATVGSSNIDPFSLLLSREANVVVDDEAFGAALAQTLWRTIETDGRRVLVDNWKQQSAASRFMCWVSYGLFRVMMGISHDTREDDRDTTERAPRRTGSGL